ncbi:MAG: TIGR04372 family glycosyltransferase [Actinobacteria bacterium]|nr:TIGR04372 family glycosyltransferase [Actinomycetota bacterium]
MNLKSKLPTRFQKYASFGIIPKLFLAPVAFLILCGFLLTKPFVQFRLYRMVDSRIGHLAQNTEIVRLRNLEHNKNVKKKEIIVYCSENWKCSNNALRKLFFRNSFRLRGPIAWLALWMSREIRAFRHFGSIANRDLSVDTAGLLIKQLPLLKFSNHELRNGQDFLASFNPNDKFVCIHARDSAYLTKTMGQQIHKHDYRDSDIQTYVAAAESLANSGYTVFRMGAIVKEPLVSAHPRVIDYATNGMRTEFLDIFLGANCKFTISTGSGWDAVPIIFRQPTLLVNHLPIVNFSAATRPLIVHPKILLDGQSGVTLNLENLIDREIAHRANSQAYKDAGVEIRDLSSEELVEAVTEMAQRVEGTFVETPEQKEMQAKLKHILSNHPKLQPSPNYYPIRAQFASCFLSRYPNFLDGLD